MTESTANRPYLYQNLCKNLFLKLRYVFTCFTSYLTYFNTTYITHCCCFDGVCDVRETLPVWSIKCNLKITF